MKPFSELHQGSHFINPKGSWCIKKSISKAVMMDNEDSVYRPGEIVSFQSYELVEPVPLHTLSNISQPK